MPLLNFYPMLNGIVGEMLRDFNEEIVYLYRVSPLEVKTIIHVCVL